VSELREPLVARLAGLADLPALGTALVPFLADLVLAIATFATFYALWRVLQRALHSAAVQQRLDATTGSFVQTALKAAVLTIGLVQALTVLGIDTAAVLTSLGIAGLSIGFAARDALANLISGVLIFWDRPFVIGDLVEVEGHYGRVERITLRSTRIVTVDGRMLAVPNATIVNTTVASYTNFPHLRLDVDVSIGLAERIDRARALLLELVQQDRAFLAEPAPRVVVRVLGDYAITLQLQAWLDDEKTHVAKRFELRERAFEALRAAGVEMPYETIQLAPVAARPLAAADGSRDPV